MKFILVTQIIEKSEIETIINVDSIREILPNDGSTLIITTIGTILKLKENFNYIKTILIGGPITVLEPSSRGE